MILFRASEHTFASSFGVALPAVHVPAVSDIVSGFLLLALPQIPLSLGNALLATERITKDFFPERAVPLRKLGFTYSFMNLAAPFLGGIPVRTRVIELRDVLPVVGGVALFASAAQLLAMRILVAGDAIAGEAEISAAQVLHFDQRFFSCHDEGRHMTAVTTQGRVFSG